MELLLALWPLPPSTPAHVMSEMHICHQQHIHPYKHALLDLSCLFQHSVNYFTNYEPQFELLNTLTDGKTYPCTSSKEGLDSSSLFFMFRSEYSTRKCFSSSGLQGLGLYHGVMVVMYAAEKRAERNCYYPAHWFAFKLYWVPTLFDQIVLLKDLSAGYVIATSFTSHNFNRHEYSGVFLNTCMSPSKFRPSSMFSVLWKHEVESNSWVYHLGYDTGVI